MPLSISCYFRAELRSSISITVTEAICNNKYFRLQLGDSNLISCPSEVPHSKQNSMYRKPPAAVTDHIILCPIPCDIFPALPTAAPFSSAHKLQQFPHHIAPRLTVPEAPADHSF